MRHGSLFSGIGGFELAAEWMGWENSFHCEWNEFGQKVLHYYWPQSEQFTDITKTNFKNYANKIDVLTGGFPCQPYSSAGKRRGKNDDRHLWPEMLRAITEISPRWIVGENVRGLTNWNGGLVFNEVQIDLEAAGYEVMPFLLPACAVNAPHRRDRIFFVAYSTSASKRASKFPGLRCKNEKINRERTQTLHNAFRPISTKGTTTNANSYGQQQCHSKYEKHTNEARINALYNTKPNDFEHSESFGYDKKVENGKLEGNRFRKSNKRNIWDTFPLSAPICTRNDGLFTELDGITFQKWRQESIKAAGNAVLPQLVYQIFKSIEQYENLTTNK